MGCVASRLEEEEEVVSICRERKQNLKLAVDRRYALAEAHFRYCQSVYGVSAAIKLFVARHSSPSSPFLITFPPPSPPKETIVSNPLFLQQTPTEPTKATIDICESCASSTASESSGEEDEEREEKFHRERKEEFQEQEQTGYVYNNHYYNMGMSMPAAQIPPMPSPQRDFGWDFFDPFATMRPEVISGYSRNSDDDLRVVREEEGIPELEEEVERVEEAKSKVVSSVQEKESSGKTQHEEEGGGSVIEAGEVMGSANVSQGEQQKGLTVIDTPVRGRELLEALKDIEDYFLRVYDSGKDVSRMLEANKFHLQSGVEEMKENSTKLIQAITLRSTSYRSSSCKSLVASNSKNSTWTEFNNDLFDDCGGMDSGSHSLTLGRLYAWEKKLYEEVKDGDSIRKIYEKKCGQMREQDARGEEGIAVDKTRAAVKDLYSRILVAIRSAESISERIEKLRDEELQPQIIELLHGLMNMWKVMMESHEIQNKIMFEVKLFTCPTYGKFSNSSHRLATLQLEAEIQNWRTRFREYVSAQKDYVEALNGWLSKFVVPEVEFCSRSRNPSPPSINGPPLLILCRYWLASTDKLPDKSVSFTMKSFAKDLRALWAQQGEELAQKNKVDSLSKELDRKILAFRKTENRVFEPKTSDHNSEVGIDHRAEYLRERKECLDAFRTKVDLERAKHQSCMQETQRVTLNGFQTGFCRVFETQIEFAKASLKMYHDLACSHEAPGKLDNPQSYIASSQSEQQAEQGDSR